MKKLLLLSVLLLTGCNYQTIDFNVKFKAVHIYEADRCYKITGFAHCNEEQIKVNIEGKGTILLSTNNCFLVADKCPMCD